jgi:branched-chain amino acid transport system permease protein
LSLGALYALVTLGLVLTFSVIDLVNFAHGDLFMAAGYAAFLLLNLPFKIPFIVVIPIVMLFTAVFAAVIERVAIHRIIDKSWRTHAITTIGISIILQNIALIIFTSDPRQTTTDLAAQIVMFGGIRISVLRLIILLVVLVVVLGLQWFVKKTTLGKVMRAVSQNREMCSVVGINVRQVAMLTFALGGMCRPGSSIDYSSFYRLPNDGQPADAQSIGGNCYGWDGTGERPNFRSLHHWYCGSLIWRLCLLRLQRCDLI